MNITRIWNRFTRSGRREASAAGYDRLADQIAAKRQGAEQELKAAYSAGLPDEILLGIGSMVGHLIIAERNARKMAKDLRAGK